MWKYRSIYYDNELYHHGVKGMKWGVHTVHRMATMHNRNSSIKKEKEKYKSGKITKAEFKQSKKAIKKNAKMDIKSFRKKTAKQDKSQAMDTLSKDRNVKKAISSMSDAKIYKQNKIRVRNASSSVATGLGIVYGATKATLALGVVGPLPVAVAAAGLGGVAVKHKIVNRVADALA